MFTGNVPGKKWVDLLASHLQWEVNQDFRSLHYVPHTEREKKRNGFTFSTKQLLSSTLDGRLLPCLPSILTKVGRKSIVLSQCDAFF